jgi:hypothetical protein
MGHELALAALMLLAACGSASADPPAAGNAANAAVSAPAPSGPGDLAAVGNYRMRGPPDEVGGIELMPDGRFRFGYAGGAVNAQAAGRWSSDGRTVTLNTDPRPTPPTFTAGPVTRGEGLTILVKGPDGEGLPLIDVRVGLADGNVITGYTQDYGWRPDVDTRAGAPQWVELSFDMYGVPAQRFPLDSTKGNTFTFTLVPNDMGVIDFRDQALELGQGELVMVRHGGRTTFVREN